MEENAAKFARMFEDIVTRLDGQAVEANKLHEAQIEFNTTISKKFQGFQKEINQTQKELDETRQMATHNTASRSVTLLPDSRVAGGSTGAQTARLANDRAPLMPEPPAT